MAATAFGLGSDPAFESFGLRRHAHRLGYGGHFLTKSRTYSTTFGALREARSQWQETRAGPMKRTADGASEGRWRAVGSGWANQGEALFAGCQQRQRAEARSEAEFAWYTRSE